MAVSGKHRLGLARAGRHDHSDRFVLFGGAVGQDRMQRTELRVPKTGARLVLLDNAVPFLQRRSYCPSVSRPVCVRATYLAEAALISTVSVPSFDLPENLILPGRRSAFGPWRHPPPKVHLWLLMVLRRCP